MIATNFQQKFPSCAKFSALSAQAQQAWAAEIIMQARISLPTTADAVPALTAGCGAAGVTDPDLWSAAGSIIRFIRDHPAPADFAAFLSGSGASLPTPGSSSLSNTIQVTDADGYKFAVRVSYSTLSVTPNLAPDSPGTTAIYVTASSSVDLINSSPRDISFARFTGNASPLDKPLIYLFEGWNASSAVCGAAHTLLGTGAHSPGAACGFVGAFAYINGTLTANATANLTTYRGLPNGQGDAGLDKVPEGAAASIQDALRTPDFFFVGYLGADASRFTDVCKGSFEPLLSGGSVSVVLWSSSGTCPTTQLASQAP